MIKTYTHICHGTCSRQMTITYDDTNNIITDLEVIGGCNGNLKGISALVKGMDMKDVHDRLIDVTCGKNPTSCPNQLALAIEDILKL